MRRVHARQAWFRQAVLAGCALSILGSAACGGSSPTAPGSSSPTSSPLPAIQSFAASPAQLTAGQNSAISWAVTGATTISLSGVGTVTGSSVVVTPADTTQYTLTATNTAGSVTQSLTVTVLPGASLGAASIDPARPGVRIGSSFLGFSHEWTGYASLMGSGSAPNPLYRQLVRNLTAYGGGPLSIRIGGNSTDKTTAPSTGMLAPLAQAYADLGTRFALGINLGAGDLSLALRQAQDYAAEMPAGSLQAIEIGNEPDLYKSNGFRASTYSVANYLAEFATWRQAIRPLLPTGVTLEGPSWSSSSYLSSLPAFLAQESSNLSVVSHHYYAGTQCNGKTNPANYLLQNTAANTGAKAVATSVTSTHATGLPFRMGEMNSISCGGETGVSDIFASALWAIDVMFEFAAVGVDGVNFHTGNGGGYSLFSFTSSGSGAATTYAIASVRPEYYGLLLFAMATANTPALLPVTLTTSANVKVWAAVDGSGAIRVVVINKEETRGGTVSLALPGYGAATVARLKAPLYTSTSGISMGGQTFDGSTDGVSRGTAYAEAVPATGGVYTVALGPTSAALITVLRQ